MEISGRGGSGIREEVSRLKGLPVRWTAPAYEDLIEILEFVGLDRPAAARKLGRELSKQSKTLASSSLRGRIVPELWQQGITEYHEILVSRYRMIYRLHPEAVRIEAVIDASRDFGDVLLRRILR